VTVAADAGAHSMGQYCARNKGDCVRSPQHPHVSARKTVSRHLFCLLLTVLACHLGTEGHGALGATPSDNRGNRGSESQQEPYLPPTEAQSWREIQGAIRDGEKLKQRDPEPYYSRAEIWSKRLENQEEALLDTLRGIDALMESDEWNDPDAKDRAFRQLRDAAWRSLDRPKSVYPGAARSHYGNGLSSLGASDFQTAADHFTRAIQLDANTPIFFYFRAIAVRNMGNESEAAIDAQRGARLESMRSEFYRSDISRELRNVQGEQRLWLESHRRGRPTYNPRQDFTLPARLSPELRTEAERNRIRGRSGPPPNPQPAGAAKDSL
jgi:hypothetical protein